MDRETALRLAQDYEIREANKKAYVKPIGYGDLLVNSERQMRDRLLSDAVLMVALVAAAGIAFWFFTPIHAVAAQLHAIARGY